MRIATVVGVTVRGRQWPAVFQAGDQVGVADERLAKRSKVDQVFFQQRISAFTGHVAGEDQCGVAQFGLAVLEQFA